MGTADVVPGVSGGTIALIVGIYERLIASVRALARGRVRDVEWGLVGPLALGIVVALAVGSVVIPELLDAYPVQMRALFFGFIAGSIAVPWRRISAPGRSQWLLAAAGAAAAFVLVGLPPRELAEPSLMYVFAAAMVAICAMILPGVSGAFLLLVFGIYEATLHALRALEVPYVLTFIAGAALGLGLFSGLLGHLLDRRHDATMAVLVGLMAGSLRALWPWLDDDRLMLAPPSVWALAGAAALMMAGFVLVRALLRVGTPAATP